MGINQNFTIIIPTYNRPALLGRLLSYYGSFEENFSVLVADSSSDENKALNKTAIASSANLDIKHLDSFDVTTPFASKIASASNHVTTKYGVFCADDDFITPSGIDKSIAFLEKNPDFVAAHGRYIKFWLKQTGQSDYQFYWTPIYSNVSVEYSKSEERLSYHLSLYSQPTIYAVHNTAILKKVLNETAQFVDDDRFGELLPSILTVIYGKVKSLDFLYEAREYLPNSTGKTSPNMDSFIRLGTYGNKYELFRNCLLSHLSRNSAIDTWRAGKLIDESMAAYFSNNIIPKGTRAKLGRILDSWHLPGWLDKGIRTPFKRIPAIRKDDSGYCSDTYSSPLEQPDFFKIRAHVLSFI